jgi:hypothetical protein
LGGIAGLSLLQVALPQPDAAWLAHPFAPWLIGGILTLTVAVVTAILMRRE